MKTKTLIIASFLIASLHAQEKPADPYRPSKATAEMPAAEEVVPTNISLCYEAFSLPLAMAAELQREHLAASAPAKLANPNAQSWYMGSGGLSTSANARRLRLRAIAGDAGRLAYVEHTAEPFE
jgi:hypothetical protein